MGGRKGERAVGADAGVIYQRVDGPEFVAYSLHQLRDACDLRQIEGH